MSLASVSLAEETAKATLLISYPTLPYINELYLIKSSYLGEFGFLKSLALSRNGLQRSGTVLWTVPGSKLLQWHTMLSITVSTVKLHDSAPGAVLQSFSKVEIGKMNSDEELSLHHCQSFFPNANLDALQPSNPWIRILVKTKSKVHLSSWTPNLAVDCGSGKSEWVGNV